MIPILSGNVASALPTGYEVANSCKWNKADDAYLTNTSYTVSGSNAAVISSNSIILGSIASERAIAIRCC